MDTVPKMKAVVDLIKRLLAQAESSRIGRSGISSKILTKHCLCVRSYYKNRGEFLAISVSVETYLIISVWYYLWFRILWITYRLILQQTLVQESCTYWCLSGAAVKILIEFSKKLREIQGIIPRANQFSGLSLIYQL